MTTAPKLILGLDPGSLRTGFGLVYLDEFSRVKHCAHGTIVQNAKKSALERIQGLSCDVQGLVAHYAPQYAVIEDVFFCKNARSALILGQARGAIVAMLGYHQIPTFSLSPSEAKVLVCGHGHAKKFQVARMVALELGIEVPQSEDASDALALALALARKNGPQLRPQGL